MGIADRLVEARRADADQPSRLEREFAKLDPSDLKALMDAARDETWSNTRLREILAREGVNVPRDSFAKWRRDVLGR